MAVWEVFNQFNIHFLNKSFSELEYSSDTLYCLDTPYINEIETNENQYHADSFDLVKQKLLIDKIRNLNFIYSKVDKIEMLITSV